MHDKLEDLVRAATILDHLGEAKLANAIDRVISKIAGPGAADPRDPRAGVPYVGPTSTNDRWDGTTPEPQPSALKGRDSSSPAPKKPDMNAKNELLMKQIQELINKKLDRKALDVNGKVNDNNTYELVSHEWGLKPKEHYKNLKQLLELLQKEKSKTTGDNDPDVWLMGQA